MISRCTADKMVTQSYSQMEDDTDELLKKLGFEEPRLRFAMYEDAKDDMVSRPDFASRFADGPVQIVTSMFRRWKGPVRINPTWADVLADAEAAISDDDHVFLEGYEFARTSSKGVRVFELFYGS